MTETTGHLLDHGIAYTAEHWPPYALAAVSLSGMTLVQRSFQAGDLSRSLPAVTVAEPIAAIALGQFLFAEHLNTRGAALPIEILRLAALAAGVFRLASNTTRGTVLERSG